MSDSSFLGDPTVPSSEGKDENSHPGSRFMVSWDFGSRLVEWLDMMYVREIEKSGVVGIISGLSTIMICD